MPDDHLGTDDTELKASGLYFVDDDGTEQALAHGSYTYDDEEGLRPALDWQVALNKIPWDKLPDLIQKWQAIGSVARLVNLIGMYVLVAIVIGAATWLATRGVIDGQAVVGFLGAAIGYLLARGRVGS